MGLPRGIMGLLLLPLLLPLPCAHPAAAQHYLRLRPQPSDHLPVPDLKEVPDPEYDPREQDLSERTLRKKLGSHFDPGFMSIGAPQHLNVSTRAVPPPPGAVPADFRKLDLTATPYGARLRLGKKARRKLVQFLWTYTHCPVLYGWKDLGVRFWPRYVKEGTCFGERSCSLPEGMFCKPVKSVTKTFLRWYCQGFLRQKYCTWIPVQYPIISECKCSC
ncbi:noggin-2-like [Astyanax mexicanus]|uniref:noggin-2-like n=1 Tax=Astyanax mexicanus TaxID=7994 RepID=UPI0020CAF4AB|nr:noggin-2-like [Astyanax mexicanus]XP_049329979.1 noggin-2-like [Astyanax mexicanus]